MERTVVADFSLVVPPTGIVKRQQLFSNPGSVQVRFKYIEGPQPEIVKISQSEIVFSIPGQSARSRVNIVISEIPLAPGVMLDPSQNSLAASDTLFVLSTSAPDLSALRSLPILEQNERRFDVCAGTGFGMFLNLLLAAGVTAGHLKQAFLTWGLPVNKIRLIEKRNRFEPVIRFCSRLISNFDQLTVKDLESDIFIPVVNGVTGNSEIICKQIKPDFPLVAVVQCCLANLLDYVPVAIAGDGSPAGTAFADEGILWSYSTFGLCCPDATLYNFYKPQKLHFTPFISAPLIEKRSHKELKSHKELAAHFQVDEIGKKLKTEETINIMSDLVPGYQPIIFESMPTMHYAFQNHIEYLLSGTP